MTCVLEQRKNECRHSNSNFLWSRVLVSSAWLIATTMASGAGLLTTWNCREQSGFWNNHDVEHYLTFGFSDHFARVRFPIWLRLLERGRAKARPLFRIKICRN